MARLSAVSPAANAREASGGDEALAELRRPEREVRLHAERLGARDPVLQETQPFFRPAEKDLSEPEQR